MTYDWIDNAWIKRDNPDIPPAGPVYGIALSSDGNILAVGYNASPYILTYDWIDNAWMKRDNPAVLPVNLVDSVALSSDGNIMAVGMVNTSPYIMTYDWIDNAWIKRDNPNAPLYNAVSEIAISADNIIYIGGSEFASYECIPLTYIIFGSPTAVGQVITADYTVDGIHKTDQYVIDVSCAIQFGEGV